MASWTQFLATAVSIIFGPAECPNCGHELPASPIVQCLNPFCRHTYKVNWYGGLTPAKRNQVQ